MKVTQRGLNNHWCVFNRNPHRLVGSALRAVGSDGKYRYSVSRDGSFVEPPWTVHPQHFLVSHFNDDMIISRYSMQILLFRQNYQKSEYTDMRDYVDSQAAHCDDVLMNRVVFESSGVTQTCIDSSSSDLVSQVVQLAGSICLTEFPSFTDPIETDKVSRCAVKAKKSKKVEGPVHDAHS